MSNATVTVTAADAADTTPTDCVITPSLRNPTEITLSSAAAGLTGLSVGDLIVITNAPDEENRGAYLITRETTANEEYTAKMQGDGRTPVTGAAGSVTIQHRAFAKKIDAENGIS